jgi:FkbM family methyltransferase
MRTLEEWEGFVANASAGVVQAVLEHLPEGGSLIDVGANVGTVSKAAIESRSAQVVAFEPVPAYYERCRELCPTATVEPYALGADGISRTLWCDDTNLGWNTMVAERADPSMTPISVPVLTFDNYAAAYADILTNIDVVKIDVEGYEYAVLAGMRATLSRFHPVLVVELGWGRNHPQRAAQVEQLEWLFANGYERIDYDLDGTTDVTIMPS